MRTQKRAKSVTFGKKKEESASKAAAAKEVVTPVEKELPKEEPVIETKKVEEEPKEAPVIETKEPEKEETSEEKEEDSLEEQLKSLKEPVEATPVEEKAEASTSDAEEETLTEDKKEEVKLDESKEDTSPFSVTKSAFSTTDGLYEDKNKKKPVMYFILVASISFILGLGAMGGYEFFLKDKDIKLPTVAMAKPTSAPTAAPTEVPSPTEEPVKKADLAAVTVEVLNGSGVKGEAAKVKTLLTEAGFTVSSTGNAATTDYTKTEISAKKTVDKGVLKELETILGKSYLVASPTTAASQSVDVVITIGSSTK